MLETKLSMSEEQDLVVKFFKTLFNDSEHTSIVSYVEDTTVRNNVGYWNTKQYFSINPLKNSRKDSNVTAYRNILLEFDKGSIEEQLRVLKSSGIPYSTLVFSGNKSLHAIISLQEEITTRPAYDSLVAAIYKKLGGKDVVDIACKNPSRLSRLPFVERQDTGKIQTLLEVHGRVSNTDLYSWLGPYEQEKAEKYAEIPKGRVRVLSGFANHFLAFGAPKGEWNIALFKTACEMARCGYSLPEIEFECAGITGKLDKKDKATIKSAYKTAIGDITED